MSVHEVARAIRSMLPNASKPNLLTFREQTLSVLAVLANPAQAERISAVLPARAPVGATSNYVFFDIPPLPPGADRKKSRQPTRPLDTRLFIFNEDAFQRDFDTFTSILAVVGGQKAPFITEDLRIDAKIMTEEQARFIGEGKIESVLYTMAQAMGTILDAANGQGARKNAGTLFEKLIRATLTSAGMRNARGTLRLPVPDISDRASIDSLREAPPVDHADIEHEEGEPNAPEVQVEGDQLTYGPEVDIIISAVPEGEGKGRIPLNRNAVDPREVLVSIKTTSKDRMAKMFVDHFVLQHTPNKDVRDMWTLTTPPAPPAPALGATTGGTMSS